VCRQEQPAEAVETALQPGESHESLPWIEPTPGVAASLVQEVLRRAEEEVAVEPATTVQTEAATAAVAQAEEAAMGEAVAELEAELEAAEAASEEETGDAAVETEEAASESPGPVEALSHPVKAGAGAAVARGLPQCALHVFRHVSKAAGTTMRFIFDKQARASHPRWFQDRGVSTTCGVNPSGPLSLSERRLVHLLVLIATRRREGGARLQQVLVLASVMPRW
jgi:hypothetical protein